MSSRLVDGVEEQVALLPEDIVKPSPETVTKLVKRLRALTLTLLPLEVDVDALTEPASYIITREVINAYSKAAGDFSAVLPYALLLARQSFIWDAGVNTADYEENIARAKACEVIARRLVHAVPQEQIHAIISTRYSYIEPDGDESIKSSALETAIDHDCTYFLASSEAQHVVNKLWRGDWVQKSNGRHSDISFVPYRALQDASSLGRLDASRLSVPRYQNWFRICVWFFYLFVYSQTVQEPLEQALDPHHSFSAWEVILYGMAFAFGLEDIQRIYKTLRYMTYRAFTFWNFVSVITTALLLTAFSFRLQGLITPEEDDSNGFKLISFQVLACVSPLIWMRLITVVDGFKYIGTMQICVSRMLQESTIFFILLSIIGIGFLQGMYALDAADGNTEHGILVIHTLIQALLNAPDFSKPATTFALVMFYLWNVATAIILLNILISLFSSAYTDVTDAAEEEFLTYFAGKTIAMIRAPDNYVYPAPFNLIELVIAPLEYVISAKAYARINRAIMTVIFFVPIVIIALFESYLDVTTNKFMRSMFQAAEEGEEEDPINRDPQVDEDGKTICKVQFEELTRAFPDLSQTREAPIMAEVQRLKQQMERLMKKLDELPGRAQ
ncbi:hypothetical protein BOTBODRAFT_165491 [Botryobasidium botryosum FD-172 SS1]|uniref:Ion transport domain-containing protein n=1 Tax=Botryobasidium botryosum (strain FD-172 SS1) TaxID=930990 RepID=A0A067MAM7_BOTB1|nr:hypothetical protein BOTBODRAFT_165491 [Botryobasidium botryosum FD-172 SS1]